MITLTQQQLDLIHNEAVDIHAVTLLADMVDDGSLASLDSYITDPESKSVREAMCLYATSVFHLTEQRVVNHEAALKSFLLDDNS